MWQVAFNFPILPIPELAFGYDPQAVIITSHIPNPPPNVNRNFLFPSHSPFPEQAVLEAVKFGIGIGLSPSRPTSFPPSMSFRQNCIPQNLFSYYQRSIN